MVSLNWVVLFKLAVMVIVLQIANIVCGSLLDAMNPKSNRGKTIKHLALSGFKYMVGCVGIFWALSILGVDLATLFASLGILALIVGFGAESLIADMVTGLFMIFENEYNVGDIIELSGYRGTVTSIGIRTTCVTDTGGNVKVFNNSDMRNIVNLSSMGSIAVCDFSIPYEVKIADAEKALEKVLKEVQNANPEVFTEMPQYKGVQMLGESAVVLRVTSNVAEADRFTAARLLNRGLKEGMERMGISCPYNQIVVRRAD
jgi:small conductance mechanosensitive channel